MLAWSFYSAKMQSRVDGPKKSPLPVSEFFDRAKRLVKHKCSNGCNCVESKCFWLDGSCFPKYLLPDVELPPESKGGLRDVAKVLGLGVSQSEEGSHILVDFTSVFVKDGAPLKEDSSRLSIEEWLAQAKESMRADGWTPGNVWSKRVLPLIPSKVTPPSMVEFLEYMHIPYQKRPELWIHVSAIAFADAVADAVADEERCVECKKLMRDCPERGDHEDERNWRARNSGYE